MEQTTVEWLQQEVILQTNLPLNLENVLVFNKLIEQAKEMEKEQKKQLVIATYVDLKMKNNKLPYGMEYLNKIAKLKEKAENYYHTEWGGWSISI